jgi:hypothetical protein
MQSRPSPRTSGCRTPGSRASVPATEAVTSSSSPTSTPVAGAGTPTDACKACQTSTGMRARASALSTTRVSWSRPRPTARVITAWAMTPPVSVGVDTNTPTTKKTVAPSSTSPSARTTPATSRRTPVALPCQTLRRLIQAPWCPSPRWHPSSLTVVAYLSLPDPTARPRPDQARYPQPPSHPSPFVGGRRRNLRRVTTHAERYIFLAHIPCESGHKDVRLCVG